MKAGIMASLCGIGCACSISTQGGVCTHTCVGDHGAHSVKAVVMAHRGVAVAVTLDAYADRLSAFRGTLMPMLSPIAMSMAIADNLCRTWGPEYERHRLVPIRDEYGCPIAVEHDIAARRVFAWGAGKDLVWGSKDDEFGLAAGSERDLLSLLEEAVCSCPMRANP